MYTKGCLVPLRTSKARGKVVKLHGSRPQSVEGQRSGDTKCRASTLIKGRSKARAEDKGGAVMGSSRWYRIKGRLISEVCANKTKLPVLVREAEAEAEHQGHWDCGRFGAGRRSCVWV